MTTLHPLVGIATCRRFFEPFHYHAVSEPYLIALKKVANVIPVMLPSLGDEETVKELLGHLDGVLLPGSPSNVDPNYYGLDENARVPPQDFYRDQFTLPLIRALIAAKTPLIAICRGCQELNVALGGTLHPKVHEVGVFADHRDDVSQPIEIRYQIAHGVHFTPNGWLNQKLGCSEMQVNSLHGQGINRLAPCLEVEAIADDQLVEAVRVKDHPFAFGFQWHPEWDAENNAASQKIFTEFGDACRYYRKFVKQ